MLSSSLKTLLYRIGLRKTLPSFAINHTRIAENGEPLVRIGIFSGILLAEGSFKEKEPLLRRGAYERLCQAQQSLPQGLHLKLYDAFLSLDEQRESFLREKEAMREEHPLADEEMLRSLTKARIADPTEGFGGHQTGGAVDVTLAKDNGEELDMGGSVCSFDEKTPSKNPFLLAEQRKNRRLLLKAMRGSGFVNYPAEWWHFCYGDRMWAAYSRKKSAFYGMAQEPLSGQP